MGLVIALGNLILGIAYGGLSAVGMWEAASQYRYRGLSRFGLGFSLIGASCGGHHFAMAWQALQGPDASVPNLLVTLLGLPAALVFCGLRIEAMRGGRGERMLTGGAHALVVLGLAYFAVIGWAAGQTALNAPALSGHAGAGCGPALTATGIDLTTAALLTNLCAAAAFVMVGGCLLDTQVHRYIAHQQWSLSGLSLAMVFPTCAAMHLIDALMAGPHSLSLPFDVFGVPAAAYFLWIVRQVHKDCVADWNRRPLAGTAGRPERASPWSGT
jgi:hypothetical protein